MPKFRDLKRYCEAEQYTLYKQTDHWYYEKILPDGTWSRTRVSFSLGKEIPHGLWQRILKQQLKTTQEEFNKRI